MPDATELLKSLKQAAIDAVEASKPVNICFGKVTSTSPLEINVEQKMTLGSKQLVLTERVTEHKVYMTVDHTTESALGTHSHSYSGQTEEGGGADTTVNYSGTTKEGGDEAHTHDYSGSISISVPAHSHGYSGETGGMNLAHTHNYSGRKLFTVHSGLAVGDEVILLRQQEGQKYIVLDRVG